MYLVKYFLLKHADAIDNVACEIKLLPAKWKLLHLKIEVIDDAQLSKIETLDK